MLAESFPGSPIVLKGALVVYASHKAGAQAKVIVFQYNPEQVSRQVAQRGQLGAEQNPAAIGPAQQDVLRVPGPPDESISMSAVLEAGDQPLEAGIRTDGLHRELAALELLLYPASAQVQRKEDQAAAGQVEIASPELPLVLLVWGRSRVVPVRITRCSVTEEAFDTRLNPLRARVELSMRVLSALDLPKDSTGRDVYFAYQANKEWLARQTRVTGHEDEMLGVIRTALQGRE